MLASSISGFLIKITSNQWIVGNISIKMWFDEKSRLPEKIREIVMNLYFVSKTRILKLGTFSPEDCALKLLAHGSKRYEAQISFTHTRITFQNWLLFLFTFVCLWNWEQVKVITWFPSYVDMEINMAFFNNFCLFIRKIHANIRILSHFLLFPVFDFTLHCSKKSTFIVKLFEWWRKQSYCGWFTSRNWWVLDEIFVKLSDASF